MVGGGEPGHIAGVADQERSHDHPHSSDVDQGGAGGGHRSREAGLVGGDVAIQAADVGEVLTCHQLALLIDRCPGSHPPQHLCGLGGGEAPLHAAGAQGCQHRVEPAHRLGAQAGELEVAFRQHPQHLGPVLPSYRRQVRRPQRGDRHRPGVVGIRLVRLAGPQHPHPGRQHRRHIHHRLASGDQLLRQQVAEPAGGLDCPHPTVTVQPFSPPQQGRGLVAIRRHRQLGKHPLVLVDRHRSVCCLVGIHPDRRDHLQTSSVAGHLEPRRALLITTRLPRRSPLSSHTAAETRRVDSSLTRHADIGVRHIESQTRRVSERYGTPPPRPPPS